MSPMYALLFMVPLVAGKAWLRRPDSNSQYYFSNDESNWLLAREHCRMCGGDLASINSASELTWMLSHFAVFPTSGRNIFVGLVKGNNGVWTWVDGENYDANLVSWKVGEPFDAGLERCAYVKMSAKDKLMDDVHCDTHLADARYVCERSNLAGSRVVSKGVQQLPIEMLIAMETIASRNERAFNRTLEKYGKIEKHIRQSDPSFFPTNLFGGGGGVDEVEGSGEEEEKPAKFGGEDFNFNFLKGITDSFFVKHNDKKGGAHKGSVMDKTGVPVNWAVDWPMNDAIIAEAEAMQIGAPQ